MTEYPPMIPREIKVDPHCVVCKKIIDGSDEKIFEDDDVVIFRSSNPVAPYHFQVVPRNHAINIQSLKDYEKQMILKIASMCKELLQIYGADPDDSIVGYYRMSDDTNPHLNFHVISPTRKMSHMNKVLYKPRTSWFLTIDQILDIL